MSPPVTLSRGWTSAFWYYSFHFQTKRGPPPHFWAEFFLGEAWGPCKYFRT